MTLGRSRVLVVGAGRAGLAAAEELRRLGFDGTVTVLGSEPEAPYYRPACSKELLTGEHNPDDVRLPVRAGTRVDWRLGQRVVDLDHVNRIVRVHTDETYRYDGLVIATGSRAQVPPGWPVGEPGIHLLHDLSDARALRLDLRWARRVAVIGGGLTGCELAHTIRSMGRDCVLIDPRAELMSSTVGSLVGGYLTDAIRQTGVELRLRRRVLELVPASDHWLLGLDDGTGVSADVVVATVGEIPNTDWLAAVPGLDLDDGVLCDQNLRVVSLDGVVAAGAVARWPNAWSDGQACRSGHWITSLEQGRAAAQTLLWAGRRNVPLALLPRFWSDQFGLRIQVCGEPLRGTPVQSWLRRDRDLTRTGLLVSYWREEALVGAIGINATTVFTSIARAMLAEPTAMPPAPVRPCLAAWPRGGVAGSRNRCRPTPSGNRVGSCLASIDPASTMLRHSNSSG